MTLFRIGRKNQEAEEKPSPGLVKDLQTFEINPKDVIEPLRVNLGEFIVLIIKKDMWATWKTAAEFRIPVAAEPLLSKATIIQSTPANFPSHKDHLAFRRIVGNAIVQALLGETKAAEETLQVAEAYATKRACETSRFWYVQASLVTMFAFVVCGVASERLKWGWPTGDGSWDHLGMAATFGAIGALFSFLSRIPKMEVDAAAGRKAHYGDAFVRIMLGGLGAFIFAVGIRAKFVMGFIETDSGENLWLLYVFCVAAGYSERIVPDFLQQVESRALKKTA